MKSVSVLRLRPSSHTHQGFDLEWLSEATADAFGAQIAEAREFRVPGTETESTTIIKLLGAVTSVLQAADLVLVDLSFKLQDSREYLYGWLLANSLRNVPEDRWTDPGGGFGKQVAVLCGELPQANSELYDLRIDSAWTKRVTFLSLRGEISPEAAEHQPPMAAFARRVAEETDRQGVAFDSEERLNAQFLRRRGVFRMNSQADEGYFKFHYDSGERGAKTLANILQDYFSERSTEVVVFDSRTAAGWFFEAIHASCIELNGLGHEILWIDSAYIDDRLTLVPSAGDTWKDETRRALDKLRSERATTSFVVPAFDRGRSLRSMQRKFSMSEKHFPSLSIMVSEDVHFEACEQLACGAYSGTVVSPRSGPRGRSIDRTFLDFLTRVQIAAIPRTDWKVLAADTLGEVEYPRQPQPRDLRANDVQRRSFDNVAYRVPNVALWSVYEDYGVDTEPLPVVPHGRSREPRDPVKNFPMLAAMDPWDSHWLAEAIVREFEDRLGRHRLEFCVVLPDEPTGTLPISDAMDKKCRASVVKVPRTAIDQREGISLEIHDAISDWAGDEIVLFDESTVTGGTLADLARLVKKITGDLPAAIGVILDLTPESLPLEQRVAQELAVPADRGPLQFSFQRWAPIGVGGL